MKLKRADITAKEKLKIAESKSKKLQITKEQVKINKKIKQIDNKKIINNSYRSNLKNETKKKINQYLCKHLSNHFLYLQMM